MSKIIIFKELERDYIYDASTEEALLKACLSVFKRRWNSRNTYYFRTPTPFVITQKEEEYLQITDSELSELPSAIFENIAQERSRLKNRKKAVEKAISDYEEWFSEAKAVMSLENEADQLERKFIRLIGTSYKSDVPSVLWLLKQRSTLNGERFSIVELDMP